MELTGRQFGHIRVTEVVGQGGMGDVYAGYDEKLERKVALKVLNSDQRLDDEARDRLLREARALSKLDHPNICRIHDYIESGDVDLLVLEYIDGRTLSDALMERNVPRSEKLRIALAIAEVLVTAHRAGIVHRDLKPENVMLTKSGEVKVLDFGLARWLNKARARTSDKHAAVRMQIRPADTIPLEETVALPVMNGNYSGRRELATAVGITLGTPLYMSPEQARGETLTPASDMFSFGLLLQTLFTGDEPHPLGLTAREVILRVARGETSPVHGAPGDVTALINRLKQFAPADRPTAIEAVGRLRFLARKPERIARRAIITFVALLALVGAWRYTVDLQAERAIAVAAQAEAERRRAQAEDLINFMVGDLRTKLEPVGRLDILDDVGTRAMQYMQSLDPSTMNVDQLARNAKALNQLGEVRLGQGKTPEALELLRPALTFAREAVRRDPHNAEAQMVLGATHFWIGNGLRLQGNTAEALQHMREYMKAGDALVSIDPLKKAHQLERAFGHAGVALILEMDGQLAEARQRYETSLEIKAALARNAPADDQAQAELARAYNKVGWVLYQLGELNEARSRFEREMAINRQLVARNPNHTEWTHRLANSMAYLARVFSAMGARDQAFALLQEELAIEQRLADRDPANVDWRRSVAVTTRRVAVERAFRGDRATAAAMFRDARARMNEAIAQAPTRKSLERDLAAIEIDHARFLAEGQDVAGARALLTAAIRRLEPFSASDAGARYDHVRGLYVLGEVMRSGDPAAAHEAWARAEQIMAPVIGSSQNLGDLDLWLRILVRRARTDEARALLVRLRQSQYGTTELETLCRESGC